MGLLISVIIPVYNTEKYIEKCVESVQSQTYKNIEIILVDDGAKDSSPEICDRLAENDSRIVVVHKANGGLSSARNAGLENATGDYITFLDSDDYYNPNMLQDLYNAIDGKKDTIACSRFCRVDENGNIKDRNDPHENADETTNVEYLRELLLHIGDVSACTKLFPRDLIINRRFEMNKLNEDLLFMTSLINEFKTMSYTGTIGYYYLCRSDSISSSYGKAIEDMAENALFVNELVQEKFTELSQEGYRFALFQNMAYLLLVPKELRNNSNLKYTNALKYLKKNFISKGLKNKYLTKKNKLLILGLMICPELVINLFQRK